VIPFYATEGSPFPHRHDLDGQFAEAGESSVLPADLPQIFPNPYFYGLDRGCPTLAFKIGAKKHENRIQHPNLRSITSSERRTGTFNLQPSTFNHLRTINHQLQTINHQQRQ
jgi:hypothetical protein